jgi:hypothetical protein
MQNNRHKTLETVTIGSVFFKNRFIQYYLIQFNCTNFLLWELQDKPNK